MSDTDVKPGGRADLIGSAGDNQNDALSSAWEFDGGAGLLVELDAFDVRLRAHQDGLQNKALRERPVQAPKTLCQPATFSAEHTGGAELRDANLVDSPTIAVGSFVGHIFEAQ